MTELPERLLSGGAGEWERALLESAQLDAPTVEFKRTFSRRLGVALSTTGVLVSGTSHALAAASWLKWVAFGFVVGTAGTGASVQLADWSKPDAPAAPTLRSATSTPKRGTSLSRTSPERMAPASAPATAEPATQGNPSKRANTPPTAAFAFPTNSVASHDATPSPAATPDLRAEMAQLESIREATARGDARSALRALDSYTLAHPSGALSLESRVLRIEALATAGESKAATAFAQRFLREHPDSPYAKRIASLALGGSQANP